MPSVPSQTHKTTIQKMHDVEREIAKLEAKSGGAPVQTVEKKRADLTNLKQEVRH